MHAYLIKIPTPKAIQNLPLNGVQSLYLGTKTWDMEVIKPERSLYLIHTKLKAEI